MRRDVENDFAVKCFVKRIVDRDCDGIVFLCPKNGFVIFVSVRSVESGSGQRTDCNGGSVGNFDFRIEDLSNFNTDSGSFSGKVGQSGIFVFDITCADESFAHFFGKFLRESLAAVECAPDGTCGCA